MMVLNRRCYNDGHSPMAGKLFCREVILIDLIFLFALAIAPASTQLVPAGDAELDAFIQQRVRAQQASLPLDAGQGFTFTRLTYIDREMHYTVEVSGMDAEDLKISVPQMISSSCETAKPFVERGVIYRYSYTIPQTGYVETLILNKEICSF
ncbi:hypothetical protein [Brevundimonas sp.]|uniref:hypothetical protein n=1 Tax=Brevundimonas sp. TaxID=1871086 RepID=UPI003D140C61